MATKDDGGPAFPELNVYTGYNRDMDRTEVMSDTTHGMSLRDYFAAAALVGMQAHPANERPDSAARWAYEVADAMLKAREEAEGSHV